MTQQLTYGGLMTLAANTGVDDAYLNSVIMWLLRAAAEGIQHANEVETDCVGAQHVDRLARLTCNVHNVLNSLRKYSEDFTGDTRARLLKMQDVYYDLRYTTEDHQPGNEDAPEF